MRSRTRALSHSSLEMMGFMRAAIRRAHAADENREEKLSRKAHLLEDKQIPSVGVFDEVFSTWKAFGENTRVLGSFGEETYEITDLHQIHEEILFTEHRDGVAGIKRRHLDPSSDGVRDLVTASRCGRLNEDLESST
ncbi:hypothetical protein Tco_0749966 [Tanacetum coccineum]|uniref:Uncharacterized protein n=1 Tax=Tanacetum coccineum TaxID=301880 RepID=A0ABQ4Z2R8_9ASTR